LRKNDAEKMQCLYCKQILIWEGWRSVKPFLKRRTNYPFGKKSKSRVTCICKLCGRGILSFVKKDERRNGM